VSLELTADGTEAYRILRWAQDNPAGRAAQAQRQMTALARPLLVDPSQSAALAEVQDAGTMLARLAGAVAETAAEPEGIGAQLATPADAGAAEPAQPDPPDGTSQAPGLPVPGDETAISMFTAHRLDDTSRHLAHASKRLHAARSAAGDLRAYHCAHVAYHLHQALESSHGLVSNIGEHYPAEAAELGALTATIGLGRSVSDAAKSATTAHLLETVLYHEAHASRHAQAMLDDPEPDDVWEFNADHAVTHTAGAVEHAAKLTGHFRDNYPAEAGWLAGLDKIAAGAEDDGPQRTQDGTVSAQMAGPESISGQLDLSAASRQKAHDTASATAKAHARERELRDEHGRWTADGDVMHYHGSLGVDRAGMPQITGTLADGRYAGSAEMMPKFLDHLKAAGIKVTHERVPAGTLKPTQTTGDMRAVRGIAGSLAAGDLADTKPVLVSSDGRVVDGHHQWAAHLLGESQGTRTGSAPGEPVIRADLPAGELMDQARQFAKNQGIQNRKTGVAANPAYARPSIAGQAAPADTLEKHTRPDGSLNPERAALHQRIISGILAGHKPQEHPVATFFGGGPASGKSTALKATHEDTAHIDPDDIKAQLPEYQQMTDAKDPRAAAYVHEESSLIARKATRQAQKRRLNFTLDGTGDSDVAKMAGKVDDARKHGYMTEGKYVTVGTGEAVKRAKARAAATGRHVPETFIRETHAAVSDTYAKAAKMGLFDKTELWDNNGPDPALVAHKEPGGAFTVADEAAWRAFLAKTEEGT